MKYLHKKWCFTSLFAAVFLTVFGGQLEAAEFTVTNTGELRQAIQDANGNGEDDLIIILAGTYVLEGASGEENSATGDIDIRSNVVLRGDGAKSTILQGGGEDRVLDIQGNIKVTIEDLTITKGNISDAGGGGIYIDGGAEVEINRLAIKNNMTLNESINGGGGIHLEEGSLKVINSAINDNQAPENSGGGINVRSGGLLVINSTISGNFSLGYGGGITLLPGAQPSTILNSTITNNDVYLGEATGISTGASAKLTLGNSLLAGNIFSDGSGDRDIVGSGYSLGGNFIGRGNVEFFQDGPKPSDQIGTVDDPIEPMLGPLQDNGGPTDTHALLPGSPAMDGGEDSECEAQDQRGVVRPLGDACDSGAFEAGCGDGTAESAEECDDGNNSDGDGCSSICKLETTGTGGAGSSSSGGGCQLGFAQGVNPLGAYFILTLLLGFAHWRMRRKV